MTVFVIGLGSMGKRRIGILKEIDEKTEIIGIESNEIRRKEVSSSLKIECFDSLENAIEKHVGTCAFVCTSPISHEAIIKKCIDCGLNVFTELNLISDGYNEIIEKAKKKGVTLFLSSTFLYRAETNYIINKVKSVSSKINYIYHIGQYLPDWHPWESYNSFFVGNPRTNGCREIFAVELPWLVTCFGNITSVSAIKSKNTSLNLNYNDNYLVQITHENGIKGVIAVDVISRKAVRKFEMFGEDVYLTWDGTPDSVFDFDIETKENRKIDLGTDMHKNGYAGFITENPYRYEIEDFFEAVSEKKESGKWSFENDFEVLNIIDRIEG